MVNIELAKPFVRAAYDFLNMELGIPVKQGPPSTTATQGTTQEINILVGVTGAVRGQIIYGMSAATAKSIASMMLAHPIQGLDRNAQSALCELGNMVSGMGISQFDQQHADVALTPPSLIAGKNIFISVLKLGCFHISFVTETGNIDVTIALEEHAMPPQTVAV
ncbi:MAG TPA: chemotaxis protein CheX [Candidatus Aquicultor sp.]|jgi:chemotaxis protein CheX